LLIIQYNSMTTESCKTILLCQARENYYKGLAGWNNFTIDNS